MSMVGRTVVTFRQGLSAGLLLMEPEDSGREQSSPSASSWSWAISFLESLRMLGEDSSLL